MLKTGKGIEGVVGQGKINKHLMREKSKKYMRIYKIKKANTMAVDKYCCAP
jgi:hypothetical protein